MKFVLSISPKAVETLKELKRMPHLQKRFKAVSKALQHLETNPRYPGLQTHEFTSLSGPRGEKVFEAYAEQNTPAAYRIFFYYGKERGEIIVFSFVPHP